MGSIHNRGFTIIETMLFLAITGLLAVAILVGSGVAIGQQRYRDSVNSLKSNLQQQYSKVSNTVNDRSGDWTCDTNGGTSQGPIGDARGTSDCVLMGRIVAIQNGTVVTASSVVGYRLAGAAVGADDLAEIKTYNMTPSNIDQDSIDVSWQSVIVKPHTALPYSGLMLIVRSPLSGAIKTFIADGVVVPPNLSALVTPADQSAGRMLCVAAPAGTFVGTQIGVKINSFASSQGAISVPLETDALCG